MDPDAEVILNISDGPSAVKIPTTCPARRKPLPGISCARPGWSAPPSTTMANSATVPGGHGDHHQARAGRQLVAVGSTVEIVVSTGKVAMPELRGRTRAEAETALKDLGLGIERAGSGELPGGAGPGDRAERARQRAVEQGKTINVVVAKAPAAAHAHPDAYPHPDAHPTDRPATGIGTGGLERYAGLRSVSLSVLDERAQFGSPGGRARPCPGIPASCPASGSRPRSGRIPGGTARRTAVPCGAAGP